MIGGGGGGKIDDDNRQKGTSINGVGEKEGQEKGNRDWVGCTSMCIYIFFLLIFS